MAKQEFDPKVLKNQRELNQAGSEYLGIQKEILATMKQMAGFQESSAAEQRKITQDMSEGKKLAAALEKFSREDIKNAKKRADFQSKLNDFKSKQADIQEDINKLAKENNKDAKELAKIFADAADNSDQLVAEAEKLSREMKRLEKITGFFEGFEGVVKDIPIVRNVFKEFTQGSKAAADNFAKFGSSWQAFGAGAEQVGMGLAKLSIGTMFTAFIQGLVETNENTTALVNTLGLGTKAGEAFAAQLASIKDGQFDFTELSKSAMEMTDALGAAVPPSTETVREATLLAERLGISAQQSAQIYKTAALTGRSFKDISDSIKGQTMAMNVNSDVYLNYRDILKDVAESSEANRITINKFPGGIQRAAYQARRLGLSFATLESAGSGLLDFEQSISAELEAELLTGKQLNLQKAREAALMGDQATLAQEIANQVGSAEEFGRMNVLQQTAVAKAVGLSREELAKSLNQREALLALEKESGIAGLARMDTEEQIAALMDQGKTKADALKALGDSEGAARAASLTASKALVKAMKNLGMELREVFTALTGMQDPLKNISLYLQRISKWISGETSEGSGKSNIAGLAGGTTGAYAGLKAANMLGTGNKAYMKAGKSILAKGGNKMMAKAGGIAAKGILGKAVPGLALGMAGTDLLQGDYVGAGINTLAGLASFVPGVGSLLAGLLGAADVGRELYLASQDEQKMAIGGIVTRPTRALVGEAGAEAVVPLNQFYAKMDELIEVVKAGGNIYLDNRKVGESMAMSYINL